MTITFILLGKYNVSDHFDYNDKPGDIIIPPKRNTTLDQPLITNKRIHFRCEKY